jgi:peptidoglycan/LPS O-acetylase OafA/YrhL
MSEGEGSHSRSRRFPCFDGLRAFAAVSVLLYHTANDSGFAAKSGYGLYTNRLDLGVSVFFLISGFLLYRPFAVAHLAGRQSPSAGRFWLRRLLRIVPAYWVALTVITYVLHADTIGVGWQAITADYGFAQIYFPSHTFSGIAQAWSLCTEMSFYLFLPLYAGLLGFRRRSPGKQLRRELIALGVLFALGEGFKIFVLNHHCVPKCVFGPDLVNTMISWLPFYLDLFALGMLLAVMSAWFSGEKSEPTWLAHSALPWASWACAAILFVIVSHVGDPLHGPLSPGNAIVTRALYGLFAFFLLFPAVFGPQDRGLVRRLLRSWPVASLGVISYGVYLWHVGWLTQIFRWAGNKQWSSTDSFVSLVILVLVFSIASSAASYFAVEQPLLKLKDGLRRPAGADKGAEITPTVEV